MDNLILFGTMEHGTNLLPGRWAMRRIALLAVMGIAGLFTPAANASISVSSWELSLYANSSPTDSANSVNTTVSLPFISTQTASTLGDAESTASYDFMTSGNTGLFHFNFNLKRTGIDGSNSRATGGIMFQVTEPSSFDTGGLFVLDGNQRIYVAVGLRDLTISGGLAGVMYQSLQQSQHTLDQEFVVGGLDGDRTNVLIGNVPTALIPGHQYDMF